MIVRVLVVLLVANLVLLALSAKASGATSPTPRQMIEWVADKPVHVECKGRFNYGGMAFIPESTVWLHVSFCLVARDNPSAFALGAALYVIGHEATHITGVWDESLAACGGLRLAPVLAERFYGIRQGTRESKQVIKGARWIHSYEPREYHLYC